MHEEILFLLEGFDALFENDLILFFLLDESGFMCDLLSKIVDLPLKMCGLSWQRSIPYCGFSADFFLIG